jgi:hypothetical protein
MGGGRFGGWASSELRNGGEREVCCRRESVTPKKINGKSISSKFGYVWKMTFLIIDIFMIIFIDIFSSYTR